MERELLLDSMARSLKVKTEKEEKVYGILLVFTQLVPVTQEVDEATKKLFLDELRIHIDSRLKDMKPGGHIEYSLGEEGKAKENLSDVFRMLPPLRCGEEYYIYEGMKLIVEKRKEDEEVFYQLCLRDVK